jgi:hypothetical protein
VFRKISRSILVASSIGILAVTAGLFSAGCQQAVTMPLYLTEYSLTNLWEKAVEMTGVQEKSTQLGSLSFRADADGRARLQYLYFHGRNQEGYPKLYRIDTKSDGEMIWHSYDAKSVSLTCEPGHVFKEIDRYGLAELPRGDDGYSLNISYQWGTLRYSSQHLSLYRLSEGNLAPLGDVFFATDSPWLTIQVAPMYVVSESVDKYGHVSKHSTASPQGESLAQTWFLAIDLNKAETVEYL